jgi:hypothetical protein
VFAQAHIPSIHLSPTPTPPHKRTHTGIQTHLPAAPPLTNAHSGIQYKHTCQKYLHSQTHTHRHTNTPARSTPTHKHKHTHTSARSTPTHKRTHTGIQTHLPEVRPLTNTHTDIQTHLPEVLPLAEPCHLETQQLTAGMHEGERLRFVEAGSVEGQVRNMLAPEH